MQTILVVEDDHDLNQSIGYSLKKSGYAVCGVTSIEKAKQMFNRNQIDLILLDVNLPDGEGFSFCRWVKAKREVPVMYLTARDMEEDALAGYDSGAEDYVIKPFSMKVLLKKIDIILKRAVLSKRMIFTDEYLYIDLENAKVLVRGARMRDYTNRVSLASPISSESRTTSYLRFAIGTIVGQWRSVCR